MAAQTWQVVGGGEAGGILVRTGQDLKSDAEASRLGTGAKVRQVELVGQRLRYEKVEGSGPDKGWVSIALAGKDLLVRCAAGGDPAAPAPAASASGGALVSVAPPQCEQTPGKPFHFYWPIGFLCTKPTGLRMSGIMAAMDDARTDLHSYCDISVEAARKCTDPHTELTVELLPAILQLSEEVASDGMCYTHPEARGAVKSWLRLEAEWGWPSFPFKVEEQNAYLVGKVRSSEQRTKIARAMFFKAFVDDATGSLCAPEPWAKEIDRFYAKVKEGHSAKRLDQMPLKRFYEPAGRPFAPTRLVKIKWLMTFSFGDLWDLHYHAKTPELLWDLNMLAGGPFAKLVEKEPDPQAIAVSLTKKMKVGTVYDCVCYLDEALSKAVYILFPQGQKMPSECCLSVTALYNWSGVPEDGATLCGEDVEMCSGIGRVNMINFANGGEAKVSKVVDLSKAPRPS